MKLFAVLTSSALILAISTVVGAQTPAAGPQPEGQVLTPNPPPPASQPAIVINPEGAKKAEQILHQVHKTYAKAQGLTDTLTVTLKSAGGNNTAQALSFAFDNNGGATMEAPGMKFVEYAEKFHLLRDDVKDKYLVIDSKSISQGLRDLFGEQNAVPPTLAFHDLGEMDALLRSLAMGRIDSIQLVNVESTKSDSGDSMQEIQFAGIGGTGKAHVTADTNLLKKVVLDIKPVGAPPGVEYQITLGMDPKILDKLPQPILFDPGTRTAVKSIDELEPPPPTPLALGEVAPDFTLSTLGGDSVTLSKLQGSVVVLDFWATWCGPCKRALPELQKFSEWAATSGKPVKVFAVDVWEREATADAKTEKVKQFWTEKGYTVQTLMDLKDEVAKLYGFQSIPTTLVIAPNGKLFRMHSGYSPEMLTMLQADVEEALNAK